MPLIRSLFLIFFVSFLQNSYCQNKHKHSHSIDHEHSRIVNESSNLIENKGQWPQGVLFNTKMEGGKIWFQQNKMIYHLQDYSAMHEAHAMKNPSFTSDDVRQTLVHVNFVGSNEVSDIEKSGKSFTYYNFFKGNDQSKWASDVHGYETFTLKNFYNGIDFKVSSKNSEVKYELLVKANINPDQVKLEYAGQDKLYVDKDGNLNVETALGKVIEKKPYAYQIINGKEVEISCEFIVNDSNVTIKLGKYDKSKELTIDPTLVFSTYVGAVSDNFGMTATYGHDGTAYSGGVVYGNNYPNPDLLAYNVNSNFTAAVNSNTNYGITDVFLSKYSADGTQMIWGTFIGGGNDSQGTETVHSMICDLQDNLYFFGATSSYNFPTTSGSFDQSFNSGNITYPANFLYNGIYFQNLGTDIYVAKLSANGHDLLGSTFVGGNGNDGVSYEELNLPYNAPNLYSGLTSNYGDQFRGEIMLDANNNILVASCTRSTNFPTVTPIQATFGGVQDGVVFKLSSNFSSLLFSTYYGGSQRDACNSIKVDNAQNILFAGGTQSTNLTGISGTWQTTFGGGTTDGFVVKLPPAGGSITAATYVGKGGYDQIFFVELDRNDNIFVLGQSVGSGPSSGTGYIPIINSMYNDGTSNNFIIKFNPNLSGILNSTRFGRDNDPNIHLSPAAFLVDNCGNIYVSGWGANILQLTSLSGMPVTPDAFRINPPNGFDFYLFVLKGDFSQMLYGTYIGGSQAAEHVDGGTSRFDKNGVVYQSVCAGCGNGYDDFPTTPGAWSSTNNSTNCNNVVYKFSTGLMPVADFVADQTSGCANFTVQFQNFSTDDDTYLWDFGNGNLDSTTFEPSITYTIPGNYSVNLYVTDSVCLLTDTAEINITVYPAIVLNTDSTINLCSSNPINLIADSDGTADYFIWSTSPTLSPALNAPTDSTVLISSPGTYYIQAGNPQCSKIDSIVVTVQPPPNVSLSVTGNEGCAPFTSSFQVTTSNSDSLIWNFGGQGTISTASTITSQNFNFTTPGNYQVTVTALNECPNSVNSTVTVTIVEPINVVTLNPIFICNNDPYTMTASITGQPTSVIWSDLADFSNQLNSGVSDYDIVVNTSGTYYIQATNGLCSDTASATITFDSPSQASFDPDQSAGCGPLTVSFNNTSVQTQSFLWDFGNGQVDSVNFEPTVTYTNPGQYQISLAIFDPDCPAADTAVFIVEVLPNVQITMQDTISLCSVIPISVNPTSIGNTNQFIWSSSNSFSDTLNADITLPQLDLQAPNAGYYYFSASNGFCSDIDSFLVQFISLNIDLSADNSICLGQTATVTAINLTPSASLTYSWTPTSIIISNQNDVIEVNPISNQMIYVSASGNGCNVSDSILINVATLDSSLVIASASDYVVLPGTTVTLFGSPIDMDSYSWSPTNGLTDPNSQQTDALIDETTIYTLSVSKGPCTSSDTTQVKVYQIICEDPYVFIPNAFSPNGDNENDILYVRGIWIEKMIFRVFDRWGELVFESTDPTIGWDGTFRGRKLDPDVYDFYLDVTCLGGLKSIIKGNVTLMK